MVNRTGGTMGDVNVTVVATDVSATESQDYNLPVNIIRFVDGQSSAAISINIISNDMREELEVKK